MSFNKLNHDQDVTPIGAAMSRHDMLFLEIPCRFENCKDYYRLGLFVIESPLILDHNLNIPVAMSFLLVSAKY